MDLATLEKLPNLFFVSKEWTIKDNELSFAID
jgi:hypothetical protein